MFQSYFLAVFLIASTAVHVHSSVLPTDNDQTKEIITNPGKCADNSEGILDRLEITNCTDYEGCTIYSSTTITLRYQPSQPINKPQYKLTFTPEGGQANPITGDLKGPLVHTRLESITLGEFEKLNVNNCKTLMKLEILDDTNKTDICVAGTITWNANPKSNPCNTNSFATGLSASVVGVFASILIVSSQV
jgi:hypothetical protein